MGCFQFFGTQRCRRRRPVPAGLLAAALLAVLWSAPFGMSAAHGQALAPEAPRPAEPVSEPHLAGTLRLDLLAAAREVDLDMSRAEVIEVLRAHGFSIEIEADLPPDGLTRMLLAVPTDDDCLPRGAPFVCPNVRVNFLNDPQRGLRVVRIEAYQTIEGEVSVAEVFRHVGAAMGPPLQTQSWPERVRGGTVSVWRQRWQEGLGQGPLLEILATQDNSDASPLGISNPADRAVGVGYVRADPDVEGSFASVRRRLLSGRGG